MQSQHHGRLKRAIIRILLPVVLVGLMSSAVFAESTKSAAEVADEIVAVQAKADEAAAQWVERDDDAQQLASDVSNASAAVAAAAATTQAMEVTLTKLAIDRYTSGGDVSFLPFSDRVMTDVQMAALAEFASNTGAADLDGYQAAETDLQRKRETLRTLEDRNQTALTKLAETKSSLDAKLSDLQALESKLKDAEVKRAYDLKLAKLRAQQEAAAAAAQAEIVARPPTTSPDRGGVAPTPPAPSPTPSPSPTTPTPTTVQAANDPSPSPAPAKTAPVTTDPRSAVQAPVTAPAPSAAIGGLICPVAGPSAFGDSWGDPRPGGRHHEGVDMMSPQGTPLVAVIDGTATMKTNALGGNTVGLKGSDGNYYYYAHLSAWEGSTRAVQQGDVVGYVGHTGDTSADHLHFGIYAGGGPAVNPYPAVRRVC